MKAKPPGIATAPGQATPLGSGEPGHSKRSKAVYRKPVLKRLGVLRSIAGSDPAWKWVHH